MSTIASITLETHDPVAAQAFYADAFGLDNRVRARAAAAPTSGFRGFAVSLVVSQPSTVDGLAASALALGASALKPVARSFWGYGGVLRDPFGTIWKIASSSKRNTAPDNRDIDDVVLLLGVEDVAATRRCYAERGLTVAKSYGRKYVEFATSPIRLALYGRRAAAKDLGVAADGDGSHRLVINGGNGSFADPDGFVWGPAAGEPGAAADGGGSLASEPAARPASR